MGRAKEISIIFRCFPVDPTCKFLGSKHGDSISKRYQLNYIIYLESQSTSENGCKYLFLIGSCHVLFSKVLWIYIYIYRSGMVDGSDM